MDVEKIIEFLEKNEVSFDVPGHYTLPNDIVIQAIKEFITTGKSEIIEKHKKWTWGCWDIDYFKNDSAWGSGLIDIEEVKELIELKHFWCDDEDIDLLENQLEFLECEKKQKQEYKYKRKQGFTQQLKNECKERDCWKCVSCSVIYGLEVDHIIPLIKGGLNEIDNLQTLCKRCHKIKTKNDLYDK